MVVVLVVRLTEMLPQAIAPIPAVVEVVELLVKQLHIPAQQEIHQPYPQAKEIMAVQVLELGQQRLAVVAVAGLVFLEQMELMLVVEESAVLVFRLHLLVNL
jgi:hypothetical protein